jgi:hypothetical protein
VTWFAILHLRILLPDQVFRGAQAFARNVPATSDASSPAGTAPVVA